MLDLGPVGTRVRGIMQLAKVSWSRGCQLDHASAHGCHVRAPDPAACVCLCPSLQSSSSGAGAGVSDGNASRTPEDILYDMAGDILDKLPPDFDLEAAQNK